MIDNLSVKGAPEQKRASHLKSLDYSVLQQCMHCGLCLPTCPTYDATKIERNSPRGRISLMRAIADDRLEVSKAFADEMYFCLGCLACMTACPAGVNYAELGGPIEGRALRMPCHDPSVFAKRREELGYKLAECLKLERTTREEAEKEAAELIEYGDRMMKVCAAAHGDAKNKGLKKGNGGSSQMPCPTGCGGTLHYTVASYNGHMHAKCETEGCASWME